MAQFGVARGLPGGYPTGYDDEARLHPRLAGETTPASTGTTVVRFAREFAANAELTEGKSMVIIGAGREPVVPQQPDLPGGHHRPDAVRLRRARTAAGMNHYVGQEKLVPFAPWATMAFANDWVKPPRLQNAPSFHYVNSDQWRYEPDFTRYHPVPPGGKYARGHAMDLQVKAVRMGWLPSYPQFNRRPPGAGTGRRRPGRRHRRRDQGLGGGTAARAGL